jgi:FkbM family methyltransferase
MNNFNDYLPEIKVYTNENNTKYALFEVNDVISNEIRNTGYWNKPFLDIVRTILKKQAGGVVVDIGAGFGAFSIPVARQFGNKFQVHAFEPLRLINLQLATNVLINNIGTVHVHKYALSNDNCEKVSNVVDVHTNGNHGAFSFNDEVNALRNIVPTKEKYNYEFRTLDSFKLQNVSFIKLSAAGMETEVLEGAKETIISNDCPPLLFEFWGDEWYKERRESIYNTLKSFGYDFFENPGGYVFAYKNEAVYDFFMSNVEVVQSAGFVVAEKVHNTKDTLADQKVYRPE